MFGHVCQTVGTSDSSNGLEVVAVGSFGSTESYIYNVGRDDWRSGPPISSARYQAVVLPLDSEPNAFVLAGGMSAFGQADTSATRYDATQGTWTDLDQTFSEGRIHATAIAIPDKMAYCVL